MAKSNWGITSGFIGKLGNVVGYNWKGKNIQRALTQNGNKSHSQEQQLQRARFALITLVGGDLYEAIYEGFRHEANKLRSTQNGLFVKYNIGLISGTDPEALGLDFANLQLSSGRLKGVDFGQASISGNNGGDSGNSGNSGSETPGGNSGSGNSGSSETPIVTAPTISGTTPFAETTQVTLTEPDGARVYYTTDGSTPTSESTLYTAPFTLSATTTVKAIAIKDGIASPVASKTFTKSSGDNGGTTE